ncbi:carbon-nitrogen hydrolase family protein [Archangium violaceum]|uniref:carbon-nitrogen hydrolase family protein n=1 Tax=Archangium violaceum TaxID=83451 RepID=UPI00194F15E0|nr:carbon-nitrogen hydrolase family protein [Archangium violaceum]QRO00965.1 carbon-nitrogen hydrolase family protein [Archangium violaceum]
MTRPHPRFKAAAVQAAPAFLDLDAGVDKAERLIAEAAENGASLIAFPETWLPGYPFWVWLGAPGWGMQFVQRYFDQSLEVDGPQMGRLREAARRHGIHVVMGYSERSGASLYMGQALIGPEGELIAARRKLKPTHAERTVFGEGDGGDLKVHATALGKLGALNCWEHIQPLVKQAMFSQGEQVHVASWPSFSLYRGLAYALGPEVNLSASQIYAVEGQCFVIGSCATVSEEMTALLCDAPDRAKMLLAGGGFAMIYGPDGRPLSQPLDERAEGLVYAELDLGLIPLAKAVADPAGHYSRPDVLRLMFNDTPHRLVERFDEELNEVERVA